MLKGYQKRVIYLKNTGSEIFKEAYFVVDERKETESVSAKELVDEANRIIEENYFSKRKKHINLKLCLFSFSCGALVCALPFLICMFVR